MNIKSILLLLGLASTMAASNGCEKKSPEPEAKVDSSPPPVNAIPGEEEKGIEEVIPKPMTVLEFVSASMKNPTGFSLVCREGTEELRRVDDVKKIDARFCSADGKVAVPPVLRIQEKQHTLQTVEWRGTLTLEGGALSWLHNDGLLVNYAPNTQEWKIRLADTTVHTFKDQAPCPFGADVESKVEAAYGGDICKR